MTARMSDYADSDFDVEELQAAKDDLDEIVGNLGEVWARQHRAYNTRHNLWDGQSEDGRKYDGDDGTLASPFNGASDTRVPLVDDIVNDKKTFAKQAFFRAEVQATPIEPGDAAEAESVSTLLKWLRKVAMREELLTEVELSAQYMFGDDPGLAVVAVDWMQDTKIERTAITFDELAGMYATGAATPEEVDPAAIEPEMLADFADVTMNREREREALGWLEQAFPTVTPKRRRRLLRDLRRDGVAEVPLPRVRENRPTVCSLRYGEDVFFPPGTADIQRARRIHRREWVTEAELRERVMTHGWDADEVEEVLKKGRGQTAVEGTSTRGLIGRDTLSISGPGMAVNETDNLFEIWWSYERRADELGVAGIYCITWSPVCKDRWLWAGLGDHRHGKYPFVVRPRERLGRQVTDSRGLSKPLTTHQYEMKVQRDARSNNTQMLATPPMKRKLMAGAAQLILGPNAEVPVMKPDDFELVQMPQLTQASLEMEKTVLEEARHYAGILTPDADPNRVFAITQDEADNFNGLWATVFEQVLELAQQFFSPAELATITGTDNLPLGLTPDSIEGRWNISLEIDARDLNVEYVTKKLETFERLLALDSQGVLDRTQAPKWGAAAIFPAMAARMIQPMQKVTQRIIDEEQGNVAKMAVGIEPRMAEDGVDAPETRLSAMVETLRNSPKLALQFSADPNFQELYANRQKYLMQQLVQEQNKTVGRLGTTPLQGNGAATQALAPAQ